MLGPEHIWLCPKSPYCQVMVGDMVTQVYPHMIFNGKEDMIFFIVLLEQFICYLGSL